MAKAKQVKAEIEATYITVMNKAYSSKQSGKHRPNGQYTDLCVCAHDAPDVILVIERAFIK